MVLIYSPARSWLIYDTDDVAEVIRISDDIQEMFY